MDATDRSPRRWLRWLMICGAAGTAIIVVVVIIVVVPSSSRPPATQAAAVVTPSGPVTLIPGARVINGVQLGFPHSAVGAISAAAELVSEIYTLDPSRAAVVARLTEDSSFRAAPKDAAEGADSLRRLVGISATEPVPAGYSVHLAAVEYQVRDVTTDEVMVILLCDFSYTKPGGKVYGSIAVLPFLMHWEHGDWKYAGGTGAQYRDLMAQPESSQAVALGWKALHPPV